MKKGIGNFQTKEKCGFGVREVVIPAAQAGVQLSEDGPAMVWSWWEEHVQLKESI